MSSVEHALDKLQARARRAAGVTAQVRGQKVVLVPTTLREAGRARAVCEHLRARGEPVEVSLESFDWIEPVEAESGTVRAGARARVLAVEDQLASWGFTLGGLSPRERACTVGEWLEGPYAGRRAVGGRLDVAVCGIGVALVGGGVYQGDPSPRSGLGPPLARMFLGAGGCAGALVEARFRALPRPEVTESLFATVPLTEDVVALVRAAVGREVPLTEVRIRRKARGYALSLTFATAGYRAARDRQVLEELIGGLGSIRPVHGTDPDDIFEVEGELSWERLPWAVAQSGPLALYRLSREGVLVASARPVKGALRCDRVPEPWPAPVLARLAGRPAPGEEGA